MSNKILIAEDDAVSRMVLEELLLEFGFEVEVCVDGQQAWDALYRDDALEICHY